MFDDLAILAPGLLGASLGWAAAEGGLARRVQVWARRPETRAECQALPWVHRVHSDPAEAVASAQLVVLAPPVEHIVPLLRRVAPHLAPGAIVTDVGSTKSLIVREAHGLTPADMHFIGSHPMAGGEQAGLAAARRDLFRGQVCFLTPWLDDEQPPLAETPPNPRQQAIERLATFWQALGMHVVSVTPEQHDEIVANISHLPHVLASTLGSLLLDRPATWRNYAGNGLRDTTRVAAGSPSVWLPIVQQNRDELLRAVSAFEDELLRLKRALANRDDLEVTQILERGKRFRDQLRVPAP